LLSIHKNNIEESLSAEEIDFVFKQFNLQKTKTSDEKRLRNTLIPICRSISVKKEKVYSLKLRKAFFHPELKKNILPDSISFISQIIKKKKIQ